jgi:thioredoxin-dependent peroxiredoxin
MEKRRMLLLVAVLVLLALGVFVLAGALLAGNKAPAVGTDAPDFTLSSQDGKPVSLHDFRGKWVVLYFYPKDMTPGCTIEARNFQHDLGKYEAKNATILGVSVQDEKTHQEFCTKESLNFKLLADTKKQVSEKYDSLTNFGIMKLSSRHTFVIDPSGKVRKVWTNVDVKKHSADVLAALEELEKSGS